MKRSMTFVCAALLAFAVGCGKKKDEKKADDKAGETKPAEGTPAGGETKPADPAATAAGEAKPAEGDAVAQMTAICKKIEELANKEGGKALEVYNARLKDCVKDMGEHAAKKGPEVTKEFGDCVNASPTFTAALENCKQF